MGREPLIGNLAEHLELDQPLAVSLEAVHDPPAVRELLFEPDPVGLAPLPGAGAAAGLAHLREGAPEGDAFERRGHDVRRLVLHVRQPVGRLGAALPLALLSPLAEALGLLRAPPPPDRPTAPRGPPRQASKTITAAGRVARPGHGLGSIHADAGVTIC